MREQTDNFTEANAARVQNPRYLAEISFSAPGDTPIQNLLLRSRAFDNAAWVGSSPPTITANTDEAPDGTTSADTLEDDNTSAFEYIYQEVSISASRVYTFSIYVKKDSTGRTTRYPGFFIQFLGSTTETHGIYLDTSTGEYEYSANAIAGGVEDIDPDWWRVWLTAASVDQSNTIGRLFIYPAAGASATWVDSNTAIGSIVAWGAQLSGTEKLIPHTQTISTAETAETGIVPANVITNSETFNGWGVFNTPSITSDIAEAPDGTTTADSIEDNSNVNYEYIFKTAGATFDNSEFYTGSIFLKKDNVARTTRFALFQVLFEGAATEANSISVDTSTGEFATLFDSVQGVAGVLDWDANWWRVYISAKTSNASNTLARVRFYPAGGASATFVFDPTITGTCIVWGAQVSIDLRLLPYYAATAYIRAIVNDRDLIRYYVSSHDDVLAPADSGGNIIHGAIKNISGQSQQIKPDSARHSIGSITVSFSDVESRITDLINLNLVGGDALNRKRIRLYKGHESLTSFDDYSLRFTYLIESIDYLDGVYNFRCDDIQRNEKTTIFEPDQGALTKSILADTDEIPITVANASTKFNTIAHDSVYSANPSAVVGYVKIDDEIIAHSGWTDGTFTALAVVERGALNTRAVLHTITQATTDQKKRVTEYFYLEAPVIKLIYALLTGVLYGQAATLPDNWHLGIDADFVRLSDFTGIGADLWDTDNNAGRLARFIGLEPTEGKEFIEKELLLWLNCFMPVYSDGALGLKRLKGVTPDSGHDAYLDESEIISYGPLRHDMKSLINNMSIKWNWIERLETFTKNTFLIDTDSIDKHSKSKLKEFEFKGVFNGVHSDSDIFNYFSAIRDRYANPPELLQIEVLPEWDRLEVGDSVRVVCSQIRDYAKPETLDRVFEIQQVKTDWITGRVWLQLFGGIERSTELTLSSTNVMADSYYTTGGTELSTVLTISAGAITANGSLTGGAENTSAIFYYDGDLTLNSGVTLTINRNVLLRIKGSFTINGTINIDGNAADAGTVGATWAGFSAFLFVTSDGNQGRIYAGLSSTTNTGIYPELPVFNVLNPNGTELTGIPPSISGVKGVSGTSASTRKTGVTTFTAGGAGGAGGGGLVVVSRGGSMGASGSINSSGAAGSTGSSRTEDGRTVYGQTGAGGFPGGLLWLIDGNYTFPSFTSDNFIANKGAASAPGGIDVFAIKTAVGGLNISSGQSGYGQVLSDTKNYFEAVTRIQYIPPAENGFKWLPEDQRLETKPKRDIAEIIIGDLDQLKSVPTGGPFSAAANNGSLFVCAGLSSGTDTEIISSPDGRLWTERSNPGTASADDARGMCYGGGNFVICCGDLVNTGSVLYSSDGITWSKVQPTNHRSFGDVAYGNGVYVLVGNDDGTDASLFTATDPATWTERANPKAFDLRAVVYSDELGLWIAGGQQDGTDTYLITATDPTSTWTERTAPQNYNLNGLAAGNGVVVGVGSTGSTQPYIIYSSDGVTWSEVSTYPFTGTDIQQVRYYDGVFYAVGTFIDADNGAVIWRSIDGANWSHIKNPSPNTLSDIAFDGACFVVPINVNAEGVLVSPRIETK